MDRKEFLRGCAGGLCACAAAVCMPVAANAAEAAKPDDWRLPFVKDRYAKLLDILAQRMGKEAESAALQELGAFCAEQSFGPQAAKYRGDLEGFIKFFSNGPSSVVRNGDVITQTFDPKGPCPCAFNKSTTPDLVCDCSIGWSRHIWSTVLGRTPQVTLKESVLRDGKRCVFEVRTA